MLPSSPDWTDSDCRLNLGVSKLGRWLPESSSDHQDYCHFSFIVTDDTGYARRKRTRTRGDHRVLRMTNGIQRPYISTDLNGDIYLWSSSPARKMSALVVAVDVWGDLKLDAPKHDAELWTSLLRRANIKVGSLHNPGRNELTKAIEAAESHIIPREQTPSGAPQAPSRIYTEVENSLFLFVYIGPGVSIKGKRFIPMWPVKDDYRKEVHISEPGFQRKYYSLAEARSLPSEELLDRFRKNSAASVVILDTQFGEAPLDR